MWSNSKVFSNNKAKVIFCIFNYLLLFYVLHQGLTKNDVFNLWTFSICFPINIVFDYFWYKRRIK